MKLGKRVSGGRKGISLTGKQKQPTNYTLVLSWRKYTPPLLIPFVSFVLLTVNTGFVLNITADCSIVAFHHHPSVYVF